MEFEVSAELVSIYLEDAREQLAVLDDVLLRLEKDGARPELMASVLGPLHTLKGNSGMIGLAAVKDFVHRLEEVFARGRDGTLGLDREALDQLFEAATALRRAIESSCAKDGEPSDLGPAQAALATLLARAADKRGPRPAAAESPEAAPARPGDDARGEAASPVRSSMVRVDFAKLDHLLNLVGELIVHRTKLNELARRVAEALPGAGPELLESVHLVESTATQLQETIMDVRMLPIRHVFERFPRLVRDLAHQQGKRVELVLQGEDTRVDKAVIDELGEPLVHLIRNAVDHGIEPPQLRRARGKSETGTLLLSAAQESNQVVITLIDDGAGIDAASVRKKAIERGLLQPGETLGDKDAIQLIFSEGFSTASAVTDVSGRGVGLDVVVRSMERLNALIEAETIPGAGTKFTLQLPLTLAIITVLMVDVGDEVYALPSGAVVESLRYAKKDLVRMNGRDTLRVRDRIVPFIHLAGLFGREERQRDSAYAVIVGRGEKRLGLSVDRLRGQQDVVIKALDAVIATEAVGIAGATILGDGRVVLILDVASLFEGRGRARTSGLGRVTAEA
ncbi:MAG TPA: chemotaxis protein CheA [Vicinamibacteria bacterium]|jgi:two-component system chemotaxis sensor kinase CheA